MYPVNIINADKKIEASKGTVCVLRASKLIFIFKESDVLTSKK